MHKDINQEINQKKFESEWQKAMINLHFTSNFFKDHLLGMLKPHNINDQHFNILRILKGRHPEAACPGDIKEVLINKRGDLTRLLDKLDKLNYVERSTNPTNRRMVDIRITRAGLQLLDLIEESNDSSERFQQNLTKTEAILLSELLDKLRR